MTYMNRSSALRCTLICSVALLLLPLTAMAHTSIAGAGDFVTGLLNPLTTPGHILILIGLGLLAGHHPPVQLKYTIGAFVSVLTICLLLTTTSYVVAVSSTVIFCLALVVGILVALELQLLLIICCVLFATAGALIGLDSVVEAGAVQSPFTTLAGTWVSATFLLVDIPIYTCNANKKWMKIGIRVTGSWIAAIAMLVLAFHFRK